jgi:hypothetical protein
MSNVAVSTSARWKLPSHAFPSVVSLGRMVRLRVRSLPGRGTHVLQAPSRRPGLVLASADTSRRPALTREWAELDRAVVMEEVHSPLRPRFGSLHRSAMSARFDQC